jgi:hypothetical protein
MEVEFFTASTIFLPLYASPQHHSQCLLFSAANCGGCGPLGSATDTRVQTLLVAMLGQEANYGLFISAEKSKLTCQGKSRKFAGEKPRLMVENNILRSKALEYWDVEKMG